MVHRLMITALQKGEEANPYRTYFRSRGKDGRTLYCDAILSAEACCKYILSTQPIDEIVVFRRATGKESGEKSESRMLRDGKSFYSVSSRTLSVSDLLIYRLAEFVDDLNIEHQDDRNLLTAKEQKEATAFLQQFLQEKTGEDKNRRLSRIFTLFAEDRDLRKEFLSVLWTWLENPEADYQRYLTWLMDDLYEKVKDTSKMEALKENENVRIRMVYTQGNLSHSVITQALQAIFSLRGEGDYLEQYVCMPNDDASSVYMQTNLMSMTRILPGNTCKIMQILTAPRILDDMCYDLNDTTEQYHAAELLSAASSFLSYGKTNDIVKCWEATGISNPTLEKIIYAMRNIDNGISLCDISDIERGIASMRSLIVSGEPIGGDTTAENYFELVLQCLSEDYGPLLTRDSIEFIDLVKWVYRKEFWQQTLTIIESRAPEDFVNRGIFCYCNSEETRDKALRVFGQIYYDLKSYEKYKLDDVSHYYIKYYNRGKVKHTDDSRAYQKSYAAQRISELDQPDEGDLQAYTVCPDQQALEDLLFAYYYIGDVRNATNHAEETFSDFYAIQSYTDSSDRMNDIRQAIDYFIYCYDRVAKLIAGTEWSYYPIDNQDIQQEASRIRNDMRKST